jgi:autotransporter-associated beta strand protein
MKTRLLCIPVPACLAAITLSSCLVPMTALAATFRWDPGQTPLTPSGGSGDWDLSTANWSNGTSNVLWANGINDYAIFGGTAGTVNVATSVNINRLIFQTSGYTLGGAVALDITGNTPQINANSGITATINSTLVFAGTDSITKSGGGKISLTGAGNSYTGATVVNGGILALETTGTLPTGNTLTISNAEFSMTGSATGPRTQTVGALNRNVGWDVITLTADAAQPITLTAASLSNRAVGSSILLRGTGLGTMTPGTAGAANILFSTAPTPTTSVTSVANHPFTSTGNGALGTPQAAVLRGVTVDTDATGRGGSFATYDPTKGVRALSSEEKLTVADGNAYTDASVGDNVVIDLTGAFSIAGKQTNTLQVNNTSGSPQTLTNSGSALLPSNGLLFTGDSETTLTGGTLTFNNGSGADSDILIYSSNSATVTISNSFAVSGGSLRSFVFGGPGNFIITSSQVPSSSNGGNYLNGPGNVELRSNSWGPSSAGTVINGGTVTLGTGFALRTTVSRPMFLANGATFDINNITLASTPTSGLDSLNNVNGYGGTATNSGDTVTNLTLSNQNGANADFAGTVSGNINLILNRQGDGAVNGRSQKFTSALTYVGSTAITSASTSSTTAPGTAANPTGFMIIGGGGSLPSTTDLTLGGRITVNGIPYGVETDGANGNGVLTLGDTVATGGPVNQTVASLATGLNPGPVTAVRGGAATNSTLTINGSADTTFAGILGGPGVADKRLAIVRGGTGHLTLSGANNYIGDTTISHPAAKLTLSSTGSLAFIIGANGVNNKIAGVAQTTGSVTLAGTFNFDLTGADVALGNSWQIVAPALLPTTSFTGLSVTGFTGAGGVWTKPDGEDANWVFRASTGALTYELSASGGGSYSTWASNNGIPGESATGDFDSDGISNLIEYALGTDPKVSTTPAGTYSGNVVTFTKGADAIANGDVSWIIQESDDLGISDPWASVVTQAAGDSSATISYTLPAGKPKVFVRLIVTQN